jgi:hypothetical protein
VRKFCSALSLTALSIGRLNLEIQNAARRYIRYTKYCLYWNKYKLVIYLLSNIKIIFIKSNIAFCFGSPRASSGIKINYLKPKWTCVKNILRYARPYKFSTAIILDYCGLFLHSVPFCYATKTTPYFF